MCSAMPSVSDLVAAPRWVGSGERPQVGVSVEGDLMGLGGTRKFIVNSS